MLLVFALGGCGGDDRVATPTSVTSTSWLTTTTDRRTSAAPATSGPAPVSTAVADVVLDEADAGTTRTARLGQTVELLLHSTYWTIEEASDPRVLAATGPQQGRTDLRTCDPGAGCGTVERWFRAVGRGTTRLRARRDVCGEVMQCRPDQRIYDVTVVVA